MRKLSNCKIILALTVIIFNSLLVGEIKARNFQYDGVDIIVDRPEGELRFYRAEIEDAKIDSWRNTVSYSTRNITVPFVFTSEGKVYGRNITGKQVYGQWPIWIEGEVTEDGDLVFENGIWEKFILYHAFYGEEEFVVVKLFLGNLKKWGNDLIISIDDNKEKKVILKHKEDGGYYIDFAYNQGFSAYKYDIITQYTLTPLNLIEVTPPQGYEEEDYQISFMEYGSIILSKEDLSTLRIKAVRTDDEIYLKGLSATPDGDPEVWVKGEISGNKVIFRNGIFLGVGRSSQALYFTPMAYNEESGRDGEGSTRHSGYYTNHIFDSTGKDLVFDYNRETGTLSNPSSHFGFTSQPNGSWRESTNSETFYIDDQRDFFYNAEIKKIPEDTEFKPLSPRVSPSNKNAISCTFSYLDEKGYMMEPEKLYIEVLVDNQPMEFNFYDLNDWNKKSGTLYPYENIYISQLMGVGGTGSSMYNWGTRFSKTYQGNSIKVNLIYKDKDDSSSVKVVEAIDISAYLDNQVYDLTGRICDPENLSPGIYIRNGKKFIVR